MIKNRIIAAMAIVAMVGCQKENISSGEIILPSISFSAAGVESRVAEFENSDGDMVYGWESGDLIGVSTNGYIVGGNQLDDSYSNVKFESTTTTTSVSTGFSVVGSEGIQNKLAPSESCDVIFNAYYPYRDEESVEIDISDQKDYFTAASNSGSEYSNYKFFVASTDATLIGSKDLSVPFVFKNVLAKIVIDISFGDDVTNIELGNATVSDIYTIADYNRQGEVTNLSNIGAIDLAYSVDTQNRTARVSAFLHPSTLSPNAAIRMVVAGDIYKLGLYDVVDGNIAERTIKGGTLYSYSMRVE